MANASLKNLQQGLKSAAAPEPPKIEAAPLANHRPDRQGKTHLGGWFPRTYSSSLRLIQAKHPEKDLQSLFSEALNDLFTKYNVPTIER
jgi:hypothetical protein